MLHTFGCSITQGFALPDVVVPVLDDQGEPISEKERISRGIHWSDIHKYAPSDYAWPQVLGNLLGVEVHNSARRGACYQQIARQIVTRLPLIQSDHTVIVAWTYLQRLSLQWPARTSVPYCHIADSTWGWRSRLLGLNLNFGLSNHPRGNPEWDSRVETHLDARARLGMDPLEVFNHCYNNLVLQASVAGALAATGATVIHLSVENQPSLQQLEFARQDLDREMRPYDQTPPPEEWYTVEVDHNACLTLFDPRIPPAENDMHPSVTHHSNFAQLLHKKYWPTEECVG